MTFFGCLGCSWVLFYPSRLIFFRECKSSKIGVAMILIVGLTSRGMPLLGGSS